MERDDRNPSPEHPLPREAASALEGAGHFAWIVDRDWRVVFMTDGRTTWASRDGAYAPVALGHHLFSVASVALRERFMNAGRYQIHSVR